MLLSPKDTASLLGVKIQTLAVWRCTRRYKLRYIKVGAKVRYRTEDVQKFIQSREVQP
jgi:predicted site-specific integrase-resolvase